MHIIKLKSIKIVLIITMIVCVFAMLGITQVNAKGIQKSIQGKNVIGESFIEKGYYNGVVKAKNLSGLTKTPSPKKTLKTKTKKINGKKYSFKIIQVSAPYKEHSVNQINTEKNYSKFYNTYNTKRKVDIRAVIPKIKGYKLIKSKRKLDPRPTGTGKNIRKTIVVNKPQNDTVVYKKTEYSKSRIGGVWISKIKKSHNKIKVTYSFQIKYKHKEIEEKIYKTSKEEYKKHILGNACKGQHVNMMECVYKKIK